MGEQTRKYLKETADDYPDIGNLVHWFIKQSKYKKKDVSNYLEVLPTTLNGYFKQRSLQLGIVWRISKAIHYNLLMDLGQSLEIPFETDIEKELRKQLAEKEEVIKRMEIQLEVFKGLGERK